MEDEHGPSRAPFRRIVRLKDVHNPLEYSRQGSFSLFSAFSSIVPVRVLQNETPQRQKGETEQPP